MSSSRLLAVLAVAAALAPAADMPTGASLLDGYIQKTGGAQAYANAKNTVMTGTVTVTAANISGNVSIYEEGEKSYTSIDIAGIGKIEEGFDGQTAWENSVLQGPRILQGDEKIEIERSSKLALISNWREVYKDARTIGLEDVDGKPAWKVEMTPTEGRPETFFFDRDSGLLVRISAVHATQLGDITSDAVMSDFRPVSGILTPFTLTEDAMNQHMVMRFTNIAYNVALPKDRFDLPEAVKALAAKKK